MEKEIKLSDKDQLLLRDLMNICIEDDLLDLQAYDSISRGERISNAWEALDVIKRILI